MRNFAAPLGLGLYPGAWVYSRDISDHFVLGDGSLTFSFLTNILEELINSESLASSATYTTTVSDGLKLLASVFAKVTVSITEGLKLGDTPNVYASLLTTLTDAIIVAESHSVVGTFDVSLTELLIMYENIYEALNESITDHFIVSETSTQSFQGYVQLQEHLIASETVSTLISFIANLSEVLVLSGSHAVASTLTESLIEALVMGEYIIIEDTEYMALVLNSETEALFKYINYPFNSFHGEYAAASDGIYQINSGSDDNGTNIDAYFETGFQDFGAPNLKRIYAGYIGFTNDGSSVLKVSTSDAGVKEEDWYEEDLTFNAFDTERFVTHDGLRSRYWKFKLSNKDGSNLDLDTLQVYPIILQRRIR